MREILTVWGAELRRGLRSARVIVLLALYGMFSGLALLVVGSIARTASQSLSNQLTQRGASGEQAAGAMSEIRQRMLGFLFDNDSKMVEALAQVPLVVLFVFKLTLFFLPAYVVLMGFDQLAGEVGTRSIRYLTVRARRSSVLLGKFLAQATVLLSIVLLVDAAIFATARIVDPELALSTLLPTLLRFWLAAIVFSLSYLALTTLCSTLFRSGGVSLAFNFIVLFVFWLTDAVGSRAHAYNQYLKAEDEAPSKLEIFRYFTPSHYADGLLHPTLQVWAQSAAAYAGFAALFLVAAHLVFRARDL